MGERLRALALPARGGEAGEVSDDFEYELIPQPVERRILKIGDGKDLLMAKAEIERLRSLIHEVPHAKGCMSRTLPFSQSCDCWKREALEGAR